MSRDPYSVYQQFRITQGDINRGLRVRDDLRIVINGMGFRGVQVELTGSCATGAGLRGADVDLTLLTTNRDFSLNRLAATINGSHSFRLMANISTAKVPILDLRHIQSGSPVDVSLNKPNGLAMSRLLRAYIDRNPLLEPMIVYIKWWAKESNLINSKNHYFSGFLFALMVIYHQQQRNGMAAVELPGLLCSEAEIRHLVNSQPACTRPLSESNLRQMAIDFFEFYANFDYKTVIDVCTKNKRHRVSSWPPSGYPIDILDPANDTNDNCASHVLQQQLNEAKQKFQTAAFTLRYTR